MSKKVNDVLKSYKGFHKDKDGWGTDPHDADIITAIGTVIKAIGDVVTSIIGAKK